MAAPDRSRPSGFHRSHAEAQDLPGSWATLMLVPCSKTPAGSRARPCSPVMLPSPQRTASASALRLSGLDHTAQALPVSASQRRLPGRHATLGSGWWSALPGGRQGPRGCCEIFDVYFILHLPGLAWRTRRSVVPRREAPRFCLLGLRRDQRGASRRGRTERRKDGSKARQAEHDEFAEVARTRRMRSIKRGSPTPAGLASREAAGTPGRSRTCDPRFRKAVLYPTELRARAGRSVAGGVRVRQGAIPTRYFARISFANEPTLVPNCAALTPKPASGESLSSTPEYQFTTYSSSALRNLPSSPWKRNEHVVAACE